jgi:outer membrane protein, heavy metal efflux system
MHVRILSVCHLALAVSVLSEACATAGEASFDAMSHEYRRLETGVGRARERDQAALSAAPLERRALIRAVLDRNPNIEAARQAWRAALARYRKADSYEDPMLMASLAPLSLGASNTRPGYEVAISQRIPLGGKLDARAELAVAEARAAESDFAQARLRLALDASELYDDYFVAVRSLEIQAQHVALMQALQQNASAAYESGHAAAQDALQAESELARLEYQSSVFETQREVAIAQINALLHRDPDVALAPPPPSLPVRDDPTSAAGALDEVIAQRPDVAAARARVSVERARINVAQRDYYPDLTLSTSYNSMWDMPQHRWMAGVSLEVPLQRGRRRAAVDEADAMRAASESEVQGATDAARTEIAVARQRIGQAERAVNLFEQRIVPVARERIEAARAGFITAQNGFMAVIEAERSLRAAELELQMARADLNKRRAEHTRALGRVPGFEAQELKP